MKSIKIILNLILITLVTFLIVLGLSMFFVKSIVDAYVPPYVLTDGSLYHTGGTNPGLNVIANAGCRGTGYNCRYLNQVSSNASYYGWIPGLSDIVNWYAYDPTIGQAAVKYYVSNNQGDNWNQVMDQSNASNKGTFVYIGYSDTEPNSGSIFDLGNACVSGWGCYSYPVYWDDMGYTR
jgi:hypothetical protein